MSMRFGLLGPLLVHDGTADRAVVSPKQQVILATLLLDANRTVSVERLAEHLWADAPPRGAHKTLHTYVMRLRQALGTAADRLHTQARGYRFEVRDGELDLCAFTDLLDAAKGHSVDGDWDRAAELLGAALALWRGQPLQGVQSAALSGETDRIAELHLDALLARIDADLHLGRHDHLVPELRDLVARHPLLERAHAFLMIALYRANRRADALAAFRSARQVLADDLGIEPGQDLQKLHIRILNADPALDLPAGPQASPSAPRHQPAPQRPAPPAQLPRGVRDFTGREAELERIRTLLGEDAPRGDSDSDSDSVTVTGTGGSGSGGTGGIGGSGSTDGIGGGSGSTGGSSGSGGGPRICVIAGAGGTGKSALAVQAAHDLRGRFPDGQLYVDLRGADTHPVEPGSALAEFIRSLGGPGTVPPDDLADRSAAFRSLLAGRRVLVLLDDAGDVRQVRPLLPAEAGCCVIVTSRSRLPGLEDCTRLELGSLSAQDGARLFARVVGDERPHAEPEAAARIVDLCGRLPLAVRIAGSRLAVRRDWPLSTLLVRLEDSSRRRLDELQTDDLQVRATLDLSYRALSPDQRRAFRLLATPDVDALSGWHATVHLGVSARTAEKLLESLVDAFLLEPAGGPDRYRYHDLTRVFAREAACAAEPGYALADAMRRTLTSYADLLAQAAAAARPGYLDDAPAVVRFAGAAEALAWLRQEFRSVAGLIAQAASGPPETVGIAAEMLYRVQWYLRSRGHWQLWRDAATAVIDGSVLAGDAAAELIGRQSCGLLGLLTGRFDESEEYLTAAVNLAQRLNDRLALARALNRRGLLDFQRGHYRQAVIDHEEAAAIFERLGNRLGECTTLVNVGKCLRCLEEPARAAHYLERALALAEELGESESATMARHHLAACYSQLGDHEAAIAAQEDCLVFTREHGLREGEAYALAELGRALLRADRAEEALKRFEEAVDRFHALGDPNAVASFLADTGFAYERLGDLAAAREAWQTALASLKPDTREAAAVRKALGEAPDGSC